MIAPHLLAIADQGHARALEALAALAADREAADIIAAAELVDVRVLGSER